MLNFQIFKYGDASQHSQLSSIHTSISRASHPQVSNTKLKQTYKKNIYQATVINKSLGPPCFFRINRKRTIFCVHTFHLFVSFSISITSLIQQS